MLSSLACFVLTPTMSAVLISSLCCSIMPRKAACTPRMSLIIYALHSRTLSILDAILLGYRHDTSPLESHCVFPGYATTYSFSTESGLYSCTLWNAFHRAVLLHAHSGRLDCGVERVSLGARRPYLHAKSEEVDHLTLGELCAPALHQAGNKVTCKAVTRASCIPHIAFKHCRREVDYFS